MGFFDRLAKAGNFLTGPSRHLEPAQIMSTGGVGPAGESFRDGWWFEPFAPTTPLAPRGQQPRRFEYVPGKNLLWTPRDGVGISFQMLGTFSYMLDVLRVVIEHSKGSIRSMDWEIHAKREQGETKKDWAIRSREDPNVEALTEFFQKPDGERTFYQWINEFLEQVLVLDALSILCERDKTGRIANLKIVDGSTIVPLVTVAGWTPKPPDPAYYQTLYGAPAFLLTTNDLLYAPMNRVIRPGELNLSIYGYPPTEFPLMAINTLLRREGFDLSFYTDGNMPEALCGVPSDWTPKQIEQLQGWFDSLASGKDGKRRRIQFIPTVAGGVGEKMNIAFPKINTASFDTKNLEWWANIIAQSFGISPQLFMRMMTRATAAIGKEMTEQIGHIGRVKHVESTINCIIQDERFMGMPDYEFAFKQRETADPSIQATIDVQYVNAGIRTRAEIREERGWDPLAVPEMSMPMITAPSIQPLEQEDEPERPQSEPQAGRKPPEQNAPEENAEKRSGQRISATIGVKGRKTEVQSLIFSPKDRWTRAEVKEWLREHDYKTEIDETSDSFRARQHDPAEFKEIRTKIFTEDDAAARRRNKQKPLGKQLMTGPQIDAPKPNDWPEHGDGSEPPSSDLPIMWPASYPPMGIRKSSEPGKLYFMRHGSTQLNDEGRIRGWSSAPLTAKGRETARQSAERLKDKGISQIVTSPLRRAKETAHIAESILKVPCEEDGDLAALNTGKFAGAPREGSGFDYYIQNPDVEIPGGESVNSGRKRMVKAIEKHYKESSKSGPQLLVVHNSVLMALLEAMTGEEPRTNQADPVPPGGIMMLDENGLRRI